MKCIDQAGCLVRDQGARALASLFWLAALLFAVSAAAQQVESAPPASQRVTINLSAGMPYMYRVYHVVSIDSVVVDSAQSPLGIRTITRHEGARGARQCNDRSSK